jgi:hypothetical protein
MFTHGLATVRKLKDYCITPPNTMTTPEHHSSEVVANDAAHAADTPSEDVKALLAKFIGKR